MGDYAQDPTPQEISSQKRVKPWMWVVGTLVGLAVLGAIIGDPTEQCAVIIDFPRLMRQTPEQAEAVLGPPRAVYPLTYPAEWLPGEYREYIVNGCEGPVLVRYHSGVLVWILACFQESSDSPEELLNRAGVDVRGTRPRVTALAASRWTGTFNGVYFPDVAAVKGGLSADAPWDTAHAHAE